LLLKVQVFALLVAKITGIKCSFQSANIIILSLLLFGQFLTNHSSGTAQQTLSAARKARWACEQVHQQMKEELGLDHFEGRAWGGLHHHAVLTMVALAFLQHFRLQQVQKKAGLYTSRGPHPALRSQPSGVF
jgi:hypothetical protein